MSAKEPIKMPLNLLHRVLSGISTLEAILMPILMRIPLFFKEKTMKSSISHFLLIGILSGLTLPLLSQSSFTIRGTITDQSSNESLPGATILIKGSPLGTTANIDGSFTIAGIKQNNITITFSFIGYEPNVLLHDFKEDPEPNFKVKLIPLATTLAQVEVEGRAMGQANAFLQQKRAENIKNVLSAEQITAFPDLNAAEAIQRIPGITLQRDQGEGRFVQLRGTPPSLTNFNINGEQIPSPEGDVRFVGLDIVATDQIDFIEVTKVLTPDMDADGIGGSINIITKKALDKDPDIRATIAGGYNNLREEPNGQLQFSYGQRYGKFGFNLNSSYFRNNQGAHNIEYKYAKGPFFGSTDAGVDNYFVQYREFQLRHYEIQRTRIGISPTLDYKFNENSSIYLMGMYNHFSDDETRRRLIYDLDDALNERYYLYGGIEHDVKDRLKNQVLASLNLGGEHQVFGVKIDYQIAYSLATEREPNRLEALFDSPGQAITIAFDDPTADYPQAAFPNDNDNVNVSNYGGYELDDLLFEESEIIDRNLTPRINIEIPYTLDPSNKGYFKFGGKARIKRKERDIRSQVFGAYFQTSNIYPGMGPALTLATVNDGFRETNLLNQGYTMEFMPSADKLRDFFEFYPQYFIYNRNETRVKSFGEDYEANEDIYAAYAMFRHDWNRLMVLGGVRFERTNVDYTGTNVVIDGNRFIGLDTLTDQRNHEFFLPQVQLRYAVNPNFNIRAALTYTYSRPNFEDVLPYREQEREEVRFGNPDLVYPSSTNVDFLVEQYLPNNGILSGGLFYKNIEDFVFFFKRFAHEGDPSNFGLVEITKAINGNKASVYGAELQAQFQFDFLNDFWKNFGLYANYTYTFSEAFIDQRVPANYSDAVVIFGEDDLAFFNPNADQEKITLPGQAKHTTNLALFYQSQKLYARFSANFQDTYLFRLGADSDLDEYYGEAWRFDFTANYAITKNVKIFTDFINLSDAPLKFYLGDPSENRVRQLEFYSWWGRFGLRLDF